MMLDDSARRMDSGAASDGIKGAAWASPTLVSTRLMFIWLLVVVAGTLAPFNFQTPVPGSNHGLRLFEYGAYQQDPTDFALNLLLFLPLGALLYHGRRPLLTTRSIAILAGTAGVLISLTVESLQVFLPSRDSSLIDVVANTGGALLGVMAGRAWGIPVEAGTKAWRARTSPAMLGALMAGSLVVILAISAVLQARTRLSDWNPDYPLLIGNERTGDRPWRGRIFSLSITDAATPLASVRRFAADGSGAMAGDPVAVFDFRGSSPYKDATGDLPGLEWTEPSTTAAGDGVRLFRRHWLDSGRPVSGLVHRLVAANAFTLRVRCATDEVNQGGPGQIVSNSIGALARNFTLGQQGADLVFRWRSPSTGENGYPFEVVVRNVFSDLQPHEILATYDGATLLIASAHANHVVRTDLTPAASAAISIPWLYAQQDELPIYHLAYLVAAALVPSALAALLAHSSRERQLFGIGWVLAFAVLFEVTLVGTTGRAFDWANVVVSAAVGGAVLTIVGLTLSQPDVEWRRSTRPSWPAWLGAKG